MCSTKKYLFSTGKFWGRVVSFYFVKREKFGAPLGKYWVGLSLDSLFIVISGAIRGIIMVALLNVLLWNFLQVCQRFPQSSLGKHWNKNTQRGKLNIYNVYSGGYVNVNMLMGKYL